MFATLLLPILLTTQEGTPDRTSAKALLVEAMAAFAWEPTVEETRRAALRYWKLNRPGPTPGRLRASAALPALHTGAQGGRLLDRTSRQETGSPVRLVRRDGLDWMVSASLEWRLDRLIFHPAELKVEMLRLRRAQMREDVAERVVRLYYARRRLQVVMRLKPARTLQAALRRRMQLARATAELDALTGGWFSRALRERRRRRRLALGGFEK